MKQQYGTPMLRRRASQPSSSCGCGSTSSSWYWMGQIATVCPNSPQPGHHSSTTYLGLTSPGGSCCCCRRFCCFLQLFLPILPHSPLLHTQKRKNKNCSTPSGLSPGGAGDPTTTTTCDSDG
ncbi:UNVERIFIED_CONTAM: hypothetical protein FKN15_073165 [Acipenser sinensis]